MRQRNNIAALKILWATVAVVLAATIIASWSALDDMRAQYERIESFTGYGWIKDKRTKHSWPKILDKLTMLGRVVEGAVIPDELPQSLEVTWSKNTGSPPELVAAENFQAAHDNAKFGKWRGTRFPRASITTSNYEVNYGFGVMTRPSVRLMSRIPVIVLSWRK